jgi:hypothetical protein
MDDRSSIFVAGGGDEASLLDILDHVLNAGVVIRGTVVISLAGVDLIYLGLNVLLTSVETAFGRIEPRAQMPGRLPK